MKFDEKYAEILSIEVSSLPVVQEKQFSVTVSRSDYASNALNQKELKKWLKQAYEEEKND